VSIRCEYTVDAENGVTLARFQGTADVTIIERHKTDENGVIVLDEDGNPVLEYVSDVVKKPQASLREALDWSARNVGLHAVQEVWKERNPRPTKAKAQDIIAAANAVAAAKEAEAEASAKLAAEKEAENARLQAEIDELKAMLAGPQLEVVASNGTPRKRAKVS
jgi:hypothetical protein